MSTECCATARSYNTAEAILGMVIIMVVAVVGSLRSLKQSNTLFSASWVQENRLSTLKLAVLQNFFYKVSMTCSFECSGQDWSLVEWSGLIASYAQEEDAQVQQYLEPGLLLSTSILAKYNFQLDLPKKYFKMMCIITMAIDCYHFLLCTNTKSRDCIIGVRVLHTPTEEKSSIHLCPLLICSECTIKRLFPTLIFKSYLSPEKPLCYPPAPFPATPNHDIAAFKNGDTPLNTRY